MVLSQRLNHHFCAAIAVTYPANTITKGVCMSNYYNKILCKHYYNKILCKLTDHDWHVNNVAVTETQFVSLGMCARCKEQWWMWGEHGMFENVRFIATEKK
jgi:hypothetical protein